MKSSCAWCHEFNELPFADYRRYCHSCGHRVGATRIQCDCRQCCSLANRNSPESLANRLANAERLLTNALNLIGVMQPVVTAADKFFNVTYDDLPDLGIAVAKYRDYVATPRHTA